MKLDDCKRCSNHIDAMADCALCRYDYGIAYRAVNQGQVISCPIDGEKKYY
jgi:hypothetical protein